MKTRNRNIIAGLFALTLCGSALAHDPGYPGDNWSGSAVVWSGSQGYAGWSGTLSFGNLYRYAPVYGAVVVPVSPGHRHGPSCHHVSRYAYERAYRKGYKHGNKQSRRHGYEHHDHH